jgi:hypothetical protein
MTPSQTRIAVQPSAITFDSRSQSLATGRARVMFRYALKQ